MFKSGACISLIFLFIISNFQPLKGDNLCRKKNLITHHIISFHCPEQRIFFDSSNVVLDVISDKKYCCGTIENRFCCDLIEHSKEKSFRKYSEQSSFQIMEFLVAFIFFGSIIISICLCCRCISYTCKRRSISQGHIFNQTENPNVYVINPTPQNFQPQSQNYQQQPPSFQPQLPYPPPQQNLPYPNIQNYPNYNYSPSVNPPAYEPSIGYVPQQIENNPTMPYNEKVQPTAPTF